MTKTIYGLHDKGGESLLAGNGWVVVTEAIGRDPNDKSGKNYQDLVDQGITPIVRLNNGYGSTGTLPLPQYYGDFSTRVANFIAASQGCTLWIIGNEPNHQNEWPDHTPIYPGDYAACFSMCLNKIPDGHKLLVAGPGPWNASVPYETNERGDWVRYLGDVIFGIRANGWADEYFEVSLHAYTHGHDPALVTSRAKMDTPFEDRHYHFFCYRDFIAELKRVNWHGPIYITELNGDDPAWTNGDNGFLQAIYEEINYWNGLDDYKISCGVVFRWQNDPLGWSIENRPAVQNDFNKAVSKGYTVPEKGEDMAYDFAAFDRLAWDNYQAGRPPLMVDAKYGITINDPGNGPGQKVARLIGVDKIPCQFNGGKHNAYLQILDDQGQPIKGSAGLPSVRADDASGHQHLVVLDKPANERKDLALWANVNWYNIWANSSGSGQGDTFEHADRADGVSSRHPDEGPGCTFGHHSFYLVWAYTTEQEERPPTQPPPQQGQGKMEVRVNGQVIATFYEDVETNPPAKDAQLVTVIDDKDVVTIQGTAN